MTALACGFMVEGSVLQGFVPAWRVDASYDIRINLSLCVSYTDNIQGQSEWEGRGVSISSWSSGLRGLGFRASVFKILEFCHSTLRAPSSVTDALV